MIISAKTLGADLRKLREATRYSQTEIAEMCGINAATMNRIEVGRFVPKLETLIKIVNALKSTIS